MNSTNDLFGTNVPPGRSEQLSVGEVSFSLENGGLRHIRLGETEILRGISFLVRDQNWGTLEPDLIPLRREIRSKDLFIEFMAKYESGTAKLDVHLTLEVTAQGLTFRSMGKVTGDFLTNRTGFTVLHPAKLAGQPIRIHHTDGTETETDFPLRIDPWQPFMDIQTMIHRSDGLQVTCAFSGDTFETEDQRQWGDASFKTYNRPLALPWPYQLDKEKGLQQSVSLSWNPTLQAMPTAQDQTETLLATFPQTAILVTSDMAKILAGDPASLADVGPQRLLCHLDCTTGGLDDQLRAFARLQSDLPDLAYDLELICPFDEPPAEELLNVRSAMDRAGFAPASVLVCPAVDRNSTPPGSRWPACPPLDIVHRASGQIFGDIRRGGGMVSFFPELNRKRPPVDMVDFVSHSLCPIVHAADDLSVMETLEAVPHITKSARAFLGNAEYRIGPCTIAMRQNPYGAQVIANPDRRRLCMADDDPRHSAAFGAAYAVGLACALAPANIAVWTPAELFGPRGLTGPLRNALAALARRAGEPVHCARITDELGTLLIGDHIITVNLKPRPNGGLDPFEWKMRRRAG